MDKYPEYIGFSYEKASKEGMFLVRKATQTGNWFEIIDRLVELRKIMNVHFDKVW